MPVLPDIPGDGRNVVVGQNVFEIIANAVQSGQQISSSANLRLSAGAAGVALEVKNPKPMIRVKITDLLLMGGLYYGQQIYQNVNGIDTTGTQVGPTASLGQVNTNTTLTLCNISEYGGSFSFVGTNTVVQAWRGNMIDLDASPMVPIYEFDVALPKTLRVVLNNDGGTNGTATAGSTATYNSLTYTASYSGQTLFTTQTADVVLVAGVVTAAKSGIAYLVEGTNTYALQIAFEPVGGPVCSS